MDAVKVDVAALKKEFKVSFDSHKGPPIATVCKFQDFSVTLILRILREINFG